jgi:Sulfotransferase family
VPAPSEVKVLFILGRGRSGSTVLDNLLGELDGFLSTGELHNVWKRGLVLGRSCGCGRPLPRCDMWSAVLAHGFGDLEDGLDPRQVVEWQSEVVDPSRMRRLLRAEPTTMCGWRALERYVATSARLYAGLREVTGARVIVDSSKRPTYGALLRLIPGIDPYFVHLVRDPRAVAFSRGRHKMNDDREMRRQSVPVTAVTWARRNRAARAVCAMHPPERSMLLRYEDFVRMPADSIREIATFVGEGVEGLSLSDEGTARLGANHTASGNPSRFSHGIIEIRLDDEWLTRQKVVDRLLATSLTIPALRRYGYPLRVGRGHTGTAPAVRSTSHS